MAARFFCEFSKRICKRSHSYLVVQWIVRTLVEMKFKIWSSITSNFTHDRYCCTEMFLIAVHPNPKQHK